VSLAVSIIGTYPHAAPRTKTAGVYARKPGITIGIGSRNMTGAYRDGTLSAGLTLNAQGRASFSLVDPAGTLRIQPGESVTITDRGRPILSGSVERVESEYPSFARLEYQMLRIDAVDHTEITHRRLAAVSFGEQAAHVTVRSLVADYLAVDGITEGTIEDAPVLAPMRINYDSIGQALDKIARLVAYDWRIDERKRLSFFSRSTYAAPWSITDGSRTYASLRRRRSRQGLANTHITFGARDLAAAKTRRFKGDAETSSFAVDDDIGATPIVEVNDVAQTIGIRGIDPDDDASGPAWFWRKGDRSVSQNTTATPIGATDVLEVTFQPLIPILRLSRDGGSIAARALIEGGSGVYEAKSTRTDIEDSELAQAFGAAFLRQHAVIADRLDIATHRTGILPGQLQTIALTEEGISGDYLVTDVEIADRGDGRVTTRYTATANENDGGWQEFFKRLAAKNAGDQSDTPSILDTIAGVLSTIEFIDAVSSQSGDQRSPVEDDAFTSAQIGTAVCGSRYVEDGVQYQQGSRIGAL